jgi:uncharacterized surface protein with fasciclin (FAS1) repeats
MGKLWKHRGIARKKCGHTNTTTNTNTMNILQKATGLACLTLGLNLGLSQSAEARFIFRGNAANNQNLVERLAGLEQYSTLVTAVTEAGLVDALAGIDQATVFAPTN